MTANVEYPSVLIGQLFPNPPLPDGRVYVAFLGTLPDPVIVTAHSGSGEEVYRSEHELPQGGTAKLDFSALLPGAYEVSLRIGNYVEVRPMMIAAPKRRRGWWKSFSWRYWLRALSKSPAAAARKSSFPTT